MTRRAFISTILVSGDNGLTNDDVECQTEATAHIADAGVFQALLATSTGSPLSRFDLTGPPWARIDGVILWDANIDARSRPPLAAIDVDPTGQTKVSVSWLGSASLSFAASENCTDWSSNLGTVNSRTMTTYFTDSSWLGSSIPCSTNQALICLEQ